MTNNRDNIVTFILDYTEENGYPPTVREIGKGVGLSSTSTVQFHLDALMYQGVLTAEKGKPRTIKVAKNGNTI